MFTDTGLSAATASCVEKLTYIWSHLERVDRTLVNTCEAISQQVRAFRASFLGGAEWEECRKRVLLGTSHAVRVFLVDSLHTTAVWHALVLPAIFRELLDELVLDELVLDEVAELFDGVPRPAPNTETSRNPKTTSATSSQSSATDDKRHKGGARSKLSTASDPFSTPRRPSSPVRRPSIVSPSWRDAIEGRIGVPLYENTARDPNRPALRSGPFQTTTINVSPNENGYSTRSPYDEERSRRPQAETSRPPQGAKDTPRPSSGVCVLL